MQTKAVYQRATDLVRSIYDKRIHTPAILPTDSYFPNAGRFIAHWQALRDEAAAVAEKLQEVPRFHELMAEQAPISANDGHDWRMFICKAYGVEIPVNLARCPALGSLLKTCPEVKTACLSFLAPHKHIPRHRGPFRGIMRFHLGLSVPRRADGTPATRMFIDDQEIRLGDGDGLLWDDTYPHEVINDADQTRTALLLDVWRPHMPLDMKILSRSIMGAAGMAIRRNKISYKP